MTGLMGSVFLLEILEDVTYSQTVARDFVSIGRTDTFTCSPYLTLSFLSLVGGIEHTVSRHNQVSLLGNIQTGTQIMTALLQVLGFSHEQIGSQHHAVTDNVHLSSLEDTGGNTAKHILLTFELQGMSGIRTTLKTSYYIITRSQNIDHLTFTFIAPLQTQQDIYSTFVHTIYYFFLFFCRVIFARQLLHTP